MKIFGSDLPPGCTNSDIERQCECGLCEVCGGSIESDCICPICPVCEEFGRMECYGADPEYGCHGMIMTNEQNEKRATMTEKRKLEDERDRLIDIEYEKASAMDEHKEI